MIKILDWTQPEEALSFHTRAILENLGWSGGYEVAKAESSILNDESQKIDFHKWPLSRSHELLTLFPARPEKVQLLESVDSLYLRGPQLWPDLILPIALKSAIRRRIQTLDLRLTAYIISRDVMMRPLVSAAVNLGFSQICLVSQDEDYLKAQKKFIERRLIGIKIDTVLTSDLTLQPQNAGLLVNALNLNEAKESLQDIAYFNFMSSNSIFVDLFEGGAHMTLQEEAARAHLLYIRPIEVEWAWWVEAGLRLQKPISVPEEKSHQFFQNLDQGLIT